MIQMGFCDDDLSVLDELHELLGSYRAEHNADIAPTAFQSPFELLASIEKGARFDILLLDVLMPGENGIEAAREIRQYDSNVKIIFLTSSAEFAVQSYTVGAYFYQLKPIWPESFFRLMDSVIAACSRESSASLILRCRTGITRVNWTSWNTARSSAVPCCCTRLTAPCSRPPAAWTACAKALPNTGIFCVFTAPTL